MNNIEKIGHLAKEGRALRWVAVISAIFFSLWGLLLALICIFALPSKESEPIAGSIFFLEAVLIIVSLVYFTRKDQRKD